MVEDSKKVEEDEKKVEREDRKERIRAKLRKDKASNAEEREALPPLRARLHKANEGSNSPPSVLQQSIEEKK